MARDYDKQRLNWVPQGVQGLGIDWGMVAFSTTDAEVEIYTHFSKVYGGWFTPIYAASDTDPVALSNEHFWLDESHGSVDGGINVSGGAVTLRRAAEPIYLMGVASTDYITSNNYTEVPIGVCEVAGTLNEAWYYNDVKNGGTPLINIGKVPSNGTGTADADYFLADAKSEAAPANSTGKSITDFTATDVAADDLITFSTTGGTTSDPQGGWCQVKITPTLTSGLKVAYVLFGLD